MAPCWARPELTRSLGFARVCRQHRPTRSNGPRFRTYSETRWPAWRAGSSVCRQSDGFATSRRKELGVIASGTRHSVSTIGDPRSRAQRLPPRTQFRCVTSVAKSTRSPRLRSSVEASCHSSTTLAALAPWLRVRPACKRRQSQSQSWPVLYVHRGRARHAPLHVLHPPVDARHADDPANLRPGRRRPGAQPRDIQPCGSPKHTGQR